MLDHRTVADIQTKAVKQSGRNCISRFFYARKDKKKITAWKSELNRILRVFTVSSASFALFFLIVPFSDRVSHKDTRGSRRNS